MNFSKYVASNVFKQIRVAYSCKYTSHISCSICYMRRYLTTNIELTRNRLKKLERHNFASVTESDVHNIRTFLKDPNQILENEDVSPYNTDWLRIFRGILLFIFIKLDTNVLACRICEI